LQQSNYQKDGLFWSMIQERGCKTVFKKNSIHHGQDSMVLCSMLQFRLIKFQNKGMAYPLKARKASELKDHL